MGICEIKQEFMESLSRDYSDETDKPMLKPINNREYWLFTEIYQRCEDLFEKLMNDSEG